MPAITSRTSSPKRAAMTDHNGGQESKRRPRRNRTGQRLRTVREFLAGEPVVDRVSEPPRSQVAALMATSIEVTARSAPFEPDLPPNDAAVDDA
jgi:hypothetical protein